MKALISIALFCSVAFTIIGCCDCKPAPKPTECRCK